MTDYPDWQQVFRLVASEITLDFKLVESDITLNVNIESAVTINVDITAQTVGNIAFKFSDQSVAVFDAAKWFAHNAQEIAVTGSETLSSGATDTIASRTVPGGSTFFLSGITYAIPHEAAAPIYMYFKIAGANIILAGALVGGSIVFDTPLRATTGQLVEVRCRNGHSGDAVVVAGMWGYDE